MDNYLQDLISEINLYTPRIAGSLAVFLGFWFGGVTVQHLLKRVARRGDPERRDILRLFGQIIKVSLTMVGLVSALGTLGINVAAMVAGLGLTGFALSFALKDVLANAVAGILVLFYRPFQRNDHVTAGGFEGQVISVDLRYTTLRTADGQVLIPNSVLFTQTVKVRPPEP